jgi:hypothetical protein
VETADFCNVVFAGVSGEPSTSSFWSSEYTDTKNVILKTNLYCWRRRFLSSYWKYLHGASFQMTEVFMLSDFRT